jgi:hypothetical protein
VPIVSGNSLPASRISKSHYTEKCGCPGKPDIKIRAVYESTLKAENQEQKIDTASLENCARFFIESNDGQVYSIP